MVDRAIEHEAMSQKGRKYAECPKCGNLMARAGKRGEVWCSQCRGYTRPYDEDDVKRDPRILLD